MSFVFFFNDTATTEIYTLSLHDALPISGTSCAIACLHLPRGDRHGQRLAELYRPVLQQRDGAGKDECDSLSRSEEHTSELQSRQYLVCRLLLEKKKKKQYNTTQ